MASQQHGTGGHKRLGRQPLLDAAAELLAELELPEAMAAIGVRAVATRAGVPPGTVNHHFTPSGDRGHNRALAVGALQHVFSSSVAETIDQTVSGLADGAAHLSFSDPESIAQLAQVAITDLLAVEDPGGEAGTVAQYLAVATAPRDPDAARILTDAYRYVLDTTSTAYASLAEVTQRRFVRGWSPQALSVVFTALVDGFVLRRRFDARQAPPELYADAAIRLFLACTIDKTALEEVDPTDALIPLPKGSQLDPQRREALAMAAGALYDADGWPAVTPGAVATYAAASRATVTAHFGDRNGLAAAIWARYLPGLQVAFEREAHLPVAHQLWGYLQRLVEIAKHHRDITAAFLEGVWAYTVAHGAPTYRDPADPRTIVPLPAVIAPMLHEHADAFRSGLIDTRQSAGDFAAFLTNSALQLSITRPTHTTVEVANYVFDTTLAGALKRRPAPRRTVVGDRA
jgi:AcrR family transcriptional regulator